MWEIVHMVQDFGSPEAVVAEAGLSPAHVRLALAYEKAYPDEIGQAIAENRRPLADAEILFPFIEVSDV